MAVPPRPGNSRVIQRAIYCGRWRQKTAGEPSVVLPARFQQQGRRRVRQWLLALGMGFVASTAIAQVPQERLDAAERQRLRWELKQRAIDERMRAQRDLQGPVSPQQPGVAPMYPGNSGYPQAGGYPQTGGYPQSGGYPPTRGYPQAGGYPPAGGYPGNPSLPANGPYQGNPNMPPAVIIVPVPGPYRPDGTPRLTPEERQVLRRQLREGHGYR